MSEEPRAEKTTILSFVRASAVIGPTSGWDVHRTAICGKDTSTMSFSPTNRSELVPQAIAGR